MRGIKLLPWQEKVVCEKDNSLAVPAPTRSGKNFTIIEAARNTPKTLIIEPSLRQMELMRRELTFKRVSVDVIVNSNYEAITNKIIKKDIRQVIFNETIGLSLLDLLRLRETYCGRIVVIGTPTDIPDPIFYPLSKIPEWTFVIGTQEMIIPYLTSNILNNLSAALWNKSILAQWC